MENSVPVPFDLERCLENCYREQESAQHQLYNNFYARCLTTTLHYSADRNEAEELVHDAFLKVFRALAERPFRGNFVRYFHRIVVNVCIDRYRVNQRRVHHLRHFAPPGPAQNDGARKLSEDDVLRFVQHLSPGYRTVFNLYVIEVFTHPEIADRLGISVSTSKSNLRKARHKLAGWVDTYFSYDTTDRCYE
jgi:RNA polymerase sigma-70 factor (ECF subfamily)